MDARYRAIVRGVGLGSAAAIGAGIVCAGAGLACAGAAMYMALSRRRSNRYNGKVVVITGGSRGLGLAMAEEFGHRGARLVLVSRNQEDLERAASQLVRSGAVLSEAQVLTIAADLRSQEEAERMIEQATERFGHIDVLVNNAGITRDAMLHKMTPQQWNDVIYVNLASIFNMSRQVIEGMRERGYGRIINISSINGQKGQMGQTNYSAAKAGVLGFTKALAQETASKGITVNAVAPGYIDTEMMSAVPQNVLEKIVSTIPVGRLGRAEEIAACVAFLAREDAAFITGATVTANGGQYFAG